MSVTSHKISVYGSVYGDCSLLYCIDFNTVHI